MISHEEYTNYLKTRSLKSLLYKFFFVFPRINFYLRGLTLDVGCGVGDFLKYKKNAVGTDINAFNIEFCKQRGLDARLIENGIFPFESNLFDSVLLDNVLEHIDRPKELISEINRVLKKNGFFVLGVPGKKGYVYDDDHKVFYDEKSLNSLLGDNFNHEMFFYTPFKSNYLNFRSRHYCLYGVFKKK